MKRLLALGLLVLLLGGCGGAKPSAPAATDTTTSPPATVSTPAAPAPTPAPAPAQPTPAPAAPAPAAPAAPAPATPVPADDPVATLKQVCSMSNKPDPAGPALSALLVAVLKDVAPDQAQQRLDSLRKDIGACAGYAVSKPGEPPLVVMGSIMQKSAVVWRDGNQWVGQDVAGLSEIETILLQREDAKGREVYLRSGNLGTGVMGAFVVLRQESGTWKKLFASPVYEKMGVKALSETWVVVTGRSVPQGLPLINGANCCMPIDYQWLYQRQGDSFKLAAERRAPDPAFTINVFMGAVRDNNTVWLSQLGSPQAVEMARRLNLAQLQVAWADNPEPKQGDPDVRSMEFAHWDALPPELNGPPPTVTTLSFKAQVPNSTATAVMTMKRLDDHWYIESITEQ